jgi:plastocyanin
MGSSERTAYASVQLLGLSLMSVLVSWLVLGDTEDLVFLSIVAIVSLLATFLVWRFDRTWARIGGLVGALAVAANVWWLAFGVFEIFSPLEFIVGLIFVVGFLVSLIWGIMALVSGRGNRTGPAKSERALGRGVLGLVGVLSIVSLVGFLVTQETVSEVEAAGATPLEMVDFEFEPDATVTDGRILIHNADPFAHDFTLEEMDVYVQVGPGSEVVVDLSSAEPGTYEYFCGLHTDPSTGEGMTGTITVES